MKMIFALMLLVLTATSFAQTCFKAVKEVSLESNLPETICIDSYKVELIIPDFPATPYYQAAVQTDKGLFTQKNLRFNSSKDSHEIVVSKNLISDDAGPCSYSYRSSVQIIFKVDSKAKTMPGELTVKGVETVNYDTCHSQDQKTITDYVAL